MPPETTTGDVTGQAPGTTQGQAPTTSTGQAPAADTSTGTDAAADLSSRLAIAERELAEARREAAKLRNESKAAREAGMSELERANARVAELERETSERAVREQDRAVRLAAVEAANALGFRSPDIAYRLIDRAEVTFNDDGEPRNVRALLKVIADRDAYLLKGNGGDFGGGNRGSSPAGTDMDAAIRQAVGR